LNKLITYEPPYMVTPVVSKCRLPNRIFCKVETRACETRSCAKPMVPNLFDLATPFANIP